MFRVRVECRLNVHKFTERSTNDKIVGDFMIELIGNEVSEFIDSNKKNFTRIGCIGMKVNFPLWDFPHGCKSRIE